MADVRSRLRKSLVEALRDRDEVATAALRAAVSAIANAEAVAPASSKVRLGVGSADVPRRELSDAEMLAILQAEIDELMHAAGEFDRLGRPDHARRLRTRAEVVRSLMTS